MAPAGSRPPNLIVWQPGILFLNAYTPNAKCSPPARASSPGATPGSSKPPRITGRIIPPSSRAGWSAGRRRLLSLGSPAKAGRPACCRPSENRSPAGPIKSGNSNRPPRYQQPGLLRQLPGLPGIAPKARRFGFWYGGQEPHRPYEYGSGVAKGHYKVEDVGPIPRIGPTRMPSATICSITRSRSRTSTGTSARYGSARGQGAAGQHAHCGHLRQRPTVPAHERPSFEDSCHLPLAMMWPKGIVSPGARPRLWSASLISRLRFWQWPSGRPQMWHAVHHW